MKLEFEKLAVAGFRSFNDKSVIYFDPGLHHVHGENKEEPRLEANGAGKSSLFDALCWCLFGQTVKKLRNTDIVPWTGNKETKVIVSIKVDDKPHKITRTVNPNNLTLDGKKVGQEDIVRLIGMDFEIFTHTILLGQGQPLFFDKSPSEKMQVLSDVLHLDRWEERSKVAGDRVKELNVRLNGLLQEQAGIERSLEELKPLIQQATDARDAWEEKRAKAMSDTSTEQLHCEEQLELLMKKWGEANLAKDGAGTEIIALKKLQRGLDAQLRSAMVELQSSQVQLQLMKRTLKQLKSETHCPTCGQPIKVNKAKLRELENNIEGWGHPSEQVEALQSQITDAERHLEVFNKKEDDARTTLDRLNPEKLRLELRITSLKKERGQQKDDVNPHLEQVQVLRKKRASLKSSQEELVVKINKTNKAIERTSFWVKGFKDVRLFIIEELLYELEIVTNAMLEGMGLVNWAINYEIERETKSGSIQRGLNVTIRSPRNPERVKWEIWSGGEQQRLRLIGSLALAEVLLNEANVHTNLEILDEPTRGLAMGGVDDLVELLGERATQIGKTILFVDHHRLRSTSFASTIHITKTKAGSSAEVLH